MEILKQRTGKPLDAIFVCCGGGGMLAGIASYVKAVRPEVQVRAPQRPLSKPSAVGGAWCAAPLHARSVQVIGVEAQDAPGMTLSLQQGRRVKLDHVGLPGRKRFLFPSASISACPSVVAADFSLFRALLGTVGPSAQACSLMVRR